MKKNFVTANLSKELRKKHRRRNISLRKGDTVKIVRGTFKKKQGKVSEVFLKASKIVVEGIQIKKRDGSKANVKLEPSNLQIIELNLSDKKRLGESKKSEDLSTNSKTEKKEKIIPNKTKDKQKNAPEKTRSS